MHFTNHHLVRPSRKEHFETFHIEQNSVAGSDIMQHHAKDPWKHLEGL